MERLRPKPEEFQVMAALASLGKASASPPTRAAIEAAARETFKEEPLELGPAFPALEAKGWLLAEGGVGDGKDVAYRLSDEAALIVKVAFSDQLTPEYFGDWMTRCGCSAAHARLGAVAYGLPFPQFDMVDREQMEALVALLARLPSGSRLLDLGSGLGTQAEYLSDRTGHRITGLDFAPASVAFAKARCAAKRDRLDFLVGNLDELGAAGLEAASFDAVLSLDSLYFAKDLGQTLSGIAGLLKPEGRLFAFFSDMRNASKGEHPGPAGTRLGALLEEGGWSYETTDFTGQEASLWPRMLDCAAKAKDDYAAEGNLDLYWATLIEAEEVLELLAKGGCGRWLYVASRKDGPARD